MESFNIGTTESTPPTQASGVLIRSYRKFLNCLVPALRLLLKKCTVVGFQILVFDMGVNLRSSDACMTEEALYGAEIGAACQQMGCIRVAKRVDFCSNTAQLFDFLQALPNSLTGQPFAMVI